MPPKRKTKRKPPKRSKSQSQSQRQSVVVNVGKTTTTKRRRNAGRGGLPPPSHLQNLFPPTIIQQQAPNIAVLENQISRLTAKIEEQPRIPVLNTPLSADTRTAEAQKMAGEKAEERRPGPTAENFQSLGVPFPVDPPPISRQMAGITGVDAFGFPLDIRQRVSPEPFRQTPQQIIDKINEKASLDFINEFDPQQVLRPAVEYYTDTLVNDKPPPNRAEDGSGGGGVEPTPEEIRRRKVRERAKKQADEKAEVKAKLDRGEELTEREKKVAGSKGGQIGTKRAEDTGFFVP